MHTTAPHHPSRGRGGFSLPEMLIVLVIIGIAIAMFVPRFQGVTRAASVQSALNRVAADLALTRMRAIRTGAPARLAISSDGKTYRVIVDPTAALPDTYKTVKLSLEYPDLVLSPTSGVVSFNSRGMVSGNTTLKATRQGRSDSLKVSGVGVIYRDF
jgi:prepilin-type N-terminal cleavage/methylation domain-containing protein